MRKEIIILMTVSILTFGQSAFCEEVMIMPPDGGLKEGTHQPKKSYTKTTEIYEKTRKVHTDDDSPATLPKSSEKPAVNPDSKETNNFLKGKNNTLDGFDATKLFHPKNNKQ